MGILIRFVSDDGHTIDFHGGDGFLKWEPFGVKEFSNSIIAGNSLRMRANAAEISVHGPKMNLSGEKDVDFSWRPNFGPKVFALVPGGWLPAVLCESTILLPDANLAGSFSLLEDEASKLRAATGLPDVPLLSMGTNRISAALAAFESGSGRLPSYHEYADKIKSIALRLQRGFPGREVVFPNRTVIDAAFAMLQEELPMYRRNTAYLAHAFPLISHRIDAMMLPRRLGELDALAARFGVMRASFVHLLAVDCLFDEGPRPKKEQRPGRRVLKPKKDFKDADLFNAVSDVMHMERLCRANLEMQGERPVLCTMDHGLVQAWGMLRTEKFYRESDAMTVNLRIDESFAPRLLEEARQKFFERLRE